MQNYLESLGKEDTTTLTLSALYEKFGYRKYRNTRFEEYSFYHDHQGFLSGEGVITFNNADGQLMALKPDMTLSIIKNADITPRSFSRIYYNENVYRFQQTTREYKEIHQCGLEMLGPLDAYAVGEIILLALKSLDAIDESYILSLSHADIVASALATLSMDADAKREIAFCIQTKNKHDLKLICEREALSEEKTDAFLLLADCNGPLMMALENLRELGDTLFYPVDTLHREVYDCALDELSCLYQYFEGTPYAEHLQLDTSIINPVDYYSGIVMQGYVKKVPHLVLAGGRYDLLAEKLREGVGAMGFAVYLDKLQAYYPKSRRYDVDVLIHYPEQECGEVSQVLMKKLMEFEDTNLTVRVEPKIPVNLRSKTLLTYNGTEWEETNA